MSVIKGILYVVSALFVLSGLLVFVPWGALNALMVTFQAPPYPGVAVVQYTVKMFFLITFWIGALLALAVRQPHQHQAVLLIFAAMFVSAAVVCLALGWTYEAPRFFYWDAVSSAVIGLLVLLYRVQALRAAGAR